MTAAVKDLVSQCNACNTFRPAQQQETLQPLELSSKQWSIVGADLCLNPGIDYLVTVNVYSDFREVDKLTTTTSAEVQQTQFSRHGIPDLLYTDNWLQFLAEEFKNFVRSWEFEHQTSSPHHSQGNGKVKSAVNICKSIFQKCCHDKSDVHRAIL